MAYNFNHRYRGRALMFANEFKNTRHKRDGTYRDIMMMKKVFETLDFRVDVYRDRPAADMLKKMKEASEDPINNESDCLSLVICSHGTEVRDKMDRWYNAVLGNDENLVYVDDIIDIFRCSKSLRGKPKLFFLQACRSRNLPTQDVRDLIRRNVYDPGQTITVVSYSELQNIPEQRGSAMDDLYEFDQNMSFDDVYKDIPKDPQADTVRVEDTQADTVGEEDERTRDLEKTHMHGTTGEDASGSMDQADSRGRQGQEQLSEPLDISVTNCPEDFLIMYPTMTGKSAFRHMLDGSYMLQYMHKTDNFKLLLRGKNILQYLTKVCKDLARYEYSPKLYDESKIRASVQRLDDSQLKLKILASIAQLDEVELRDVCRPVRGELPPDVSDKLSLKQYVEGIAPADQLKMSQIRQIYECIKPKLKFKSLRIIFFQCTKHLSHAEQKDLLAGILGDLPEELVLREQVLKHYFEAATESDTAKVGYMVRILEAISPFKISGCVVHRLRGEVSFLHAKGENTLMAHAMRVVQAETA